MRNRLQILDREDNSLLKLKRVQKKAKDNHQQKDRKCAAPLLSIVSVPMRWFLLWLGRKMTEELRTGKNWVQALARRLLWPIKGDGEVWVVAPFWLLSNTNLSKWETRTLAQWCMKEEEKEGERNKWEFQIILGERKRKGPRGRRMNRLDVLEGILELVIPSARGRPEGARQTGKGLKRPRSKQRTDNTRKQVSNSKGKKNHTCFWCRSLLKEKKMN